MACSTFMVIALTSAFWRPTVKGCVRNKIKKSLVSVCRYAFWGHRSVELLWIFSVECALIQADPVSVCKLEEIWVIIHNEAVV